MLLTCEHATNDLKMIRPRDDEQALLRGNDGYDPGSGLITNTISE